MQLQSKPFVFKKAYFYIFNQKNRGLKDKFSGKTAELLPIKLQIYSKIFFFNVISVRSEIMSLKSDQLDILGVVALRDLKLNCLMYADELILVQRVKKDCKIAFTN